MDAEFLINILGSIMLIFFSFLLPLVMCFLTGVWVAAPEGVEEKFSLFFKRFVSFMWFLLGMIFSVQIMYFLSALFNPVSRCVALGTCPSEMASAVVGLNFWFIIFPFLLFYLGFKLSKDVNASRLNPPKQINL